MLVLAEKILILSMKLEKSRWKVIRLTGKLLGIFPVHYSRWMEKRLFRGNWDPVKRRRRQKSRRFHRRNRP